MSCPTTQLADALVAALQAQAWPVPVTVSRQLRPRFLWEGIDDAQMAVVPRGRARAVQTRGTDDLTHVLEIGIYRRLSDPNDPAEADPLMALVDQLERFLLRLDLGAICIEVQSVLADDSIAARELLQEGAFAAVLTARFWEPSP